jgi:large subunit ribosomal protein L30
MAEVGGSLSKGIMADKGTIRVKWVRSGIGFTKHQKEMIRNLGLHRLHEVAERADTPSVRGLVAKVPHFVEIVGEKPAPAWANVPEYRISSPPLAPQAKEAAHSHAEALAPASEEGLQGSPETATAHPGVASVPDLEVGVAGDASTGGSAEDVKDDVK